MVLDHVGTHKALAFGSELSAFQAPGASRVGPPPAGGQATDPAPGSGRAPSSGDVAARPTNVRGNPMLRALAAAGLATAILGAAGWLAYTRLKETLVANFDALNAKLDEQDAARTAATDRIAEDVQALKDQIAALELDTADQAKVDEIVNRVQANVDALNAIDPVRADEGNTPTEPVEPANPNV